MVLKDHVRRGKKFIPRMHDLPVRETVWHMERLPELFWLAFVVNRLDARATLELAYEMAVDIESTVKRMRSDKKAFRAYWLSEHNSCSDNEREQIVTDHGDSNWLRELEPHFVDMTLLWPDLPVSYLISPTDDRTTIPEIVGEVKDLLRHCSYRYDKRALVIQAMTVALESRTRHLFFPRDLDIPDLNAVFNYPNTEESRHAAGFVVTSCGAMTLCRSGPNGEPDFQWQRSFWNSCFRQEPCEYE